MRRVIYVLLAFALAPSAFADDLSWLTGPQASNVPVVNGWAGIYIGGQVSYSNAGGDFSKTTQAPLAYVLRDLTLESEQQPSSWPVLGQANHSATGFGGFAGYNTQFERLVLGVEANYDQANLSLIAPNLPFSFTGTAGKSGEWMYGVTVGGGLDVALTRNVFLRAEYEYVQFAAIANLVVQVNTVRGGLGVKF